MISILQLVKTSGGVILIKTNKRTKRRDISGRTFGSGPNDTLDGT